MAIVLEIAALNEPSLAITRRCLIEWLLLGIVLLILGAFISHALYAEYGRIEMQEQDRLLTQAQVIDDNLTRQLESINKALIEIRNQLSPSDGIRNDRLPVWDGQTIDPEVSSHLKMLVTIMPGVRTLLVLNAEGTVLAANRNELIGKNFSERAYFKVPRESPDPATFYVSPPLKTSLGAFSIAVGKVLAGPKGEFAGVIAATLDPDYFNVVLRSVLYAPDMWVSLAHQDGQLFLSIPYGENLLGLDLSTSGSLFNQHRDSGKTASVLIGMSLTTGQQSIVARRTIQPMALHMNKALVVAVARNWAALYLIWYEQVQIYSGLYGLLTLVMSLGLSVVQQRRRVFESWTAAHQKEQRENAERLELALSGADLGMWDWHLPSGTAVFNERWASMLGCTLSDLALDHSSWRDRIPREDWLIIRVPLGAHLRGETPRYQIEHRMRHQNGSFIWVLTKGKVIEWDAAGAPVRVVGTLVDISQRKQSEIALQEHEETYRTVADFTYDWEYWLNPDGSFRYISPACERITGYRVNDFQQDPELMIRIIHPDDRHILASHLSACSNPLLDPNKHAFDFRIYTRAGEERWIAHCCQPVYGHSGAYLGSRASNRDITERKQTEIILEQAEQRFHFLFQNMRSAVVIYDAIQEGSDFVFKEVNAAMLRIEHLSREQVLGQRVTELFPGIQAMGLLAVFQRVWRSGTPEHYPLSFYTDDRNKGWRENFVYRLDTGELVAIYEDVTARKSAEEEIRSLALYDPLTRLPNRRLLQDRLHQALVAVTRTDRCGALVFIDLDQFKMLNDTRGHHIGDLLLAQVGYRLTHCVREGDTVARLGGDEFVVMLENLSTQPLFAAAQARVVGEKILLALNQPYLLDASECHNTPSIGITLIRNPPPSVAELFKQADLAMYEAKALGRNALRFFQPEMQAANTARATLEADLHAGLQQGQFQLYYQAQVDHEGYLTGAEALVRWQHPQRGMVSPAEFIPMAEETGFILPLGIWVLETACRQLTEWSKQPDRESLTVAVNISARQFRQPDFVAQVQRVLNQTGANPHRLKLELTESLLLDNVDEIIVKMTTLKTCGVRFSLDDFGTGYSSLTYLKRLPLDQLKIDQSFVRDIHTDPNDAAITRTIVALAQSLGLTVIAEGVETMEQRDFLIDNNCYAFQGYLFGRPGPVGALRGSPSLAPAPPPGHCWSAG